MVLMNKWLFYFILFVLNLNNNSYRNSNTGPELRVITSLISLQRKSQDMIFINLFLNSLVTTGSQI